MKIHNKYSFGLFTSDKWAEMFNLTSLNLSLISKNVGHIVTKLLDI